MHPNMPYFVTKEAIALIDGKEHVVKNIWEQNQYTRYIQDGKGKTIFSQYFRIIQIIN